MKSEHKIVGINVEEIKKEEFMKYISQKKEEFMKYISQKSIFL